MVLDYRERKPVNKNRPKSKPVGLYVVAFGAVACCSFVLGIVTDRFLLPPRNLTRNTVPVGQTPSSASTPPALPAAAGNASGAVQQNVPLQEPSLTFYETLPKGGRAILGSGINPKRPDAHDGTVKPGGAASSHKDSTVPPQVETKPAQKIESPPALPVVPQYRSVATDAVERQQVSDASVKEATAKKAAITAKGKFIVQVSSVKERKEAEAIKAALQEKGFAAYVVESPVAGKGTWYRVRVGKQMDQTAASSLVRQIGRGAMIISE